MPWRRQSEGSNLRISPCVRGSAGPIAAVQTLPSRSDTITGWLGQLRKSGRRPTALSLGRRAVLGSRSLPCCICRSGGPAGFPCFGGECSGRSLAFGCVLSLVMTFILLGARHIRRDPAGDRSRRIRARRRRLLMARCDPLGAQYEHHDDRPDEHRRRLVRRTSAEGWNC